MTDDALYRRIMADNAGLWAAPVQGVLRLGEVVYGAAVKSRNRRYDRAESVVYVSKPVVSVGNITVGGTGKTPFVVAVARRLGDLGASPAVVARGYGSDAGRPNDEELLIRRQCPDVPYVADPDRVMAARYAIKAFGADVVVLDDGFQHRRLGRTIDIVLIDATCPFGFNHLLPRGLLREPVEALRRAQLVALTRCEQASPMDVERLFKTVSRIAADADVIKCRHAVTGVEDLAGHDLTRTLPGRKAALFAAIGHPASFRHTVSSLGVDVVGHQWFPDHHRYAKRDIDGLLAVGRFPPHDLLLTTEKDAVKLAQLPSLEHASIGVVKVAIDFVDDGGTILSRVLERALATSDQA